jgi:serine/threonine-protein kinase
MPLSRTEVERRALALFERIRAKPRARARLLASEPTLVRGRVAALERAAAPGLLVTLAGDGEPATPPERVGAFRLLRPIGTGGMGSVWLGERDDGLFEQRVAVKFLQSHLGDRAAERFRAERRLLAMLDAPGIARIIDGGVTDAGLAYVVMDHIEGETLDRAAAGLSIARRARLFAEVCEAVQFAHAKLVVHGDLKPGNVMVDAAGRARLLDFGVARLLNTDEDDGHAVPFTPAYASPERRAGAPPSIADDVFALGRMLGDLVEGEADADLTAIASQATRGEPADRYPSVGALIADVGRWQERLPVSARRATLAYRARLFVARHAWGVGLTAAAMLLLAGFAAVATQNYLEAERARAEAEQRFGEVRSISRYLLFDLYDRLADAPGTVETRVRLAETAGRYLDRLNATPNAPLDLKLEMAQGYRRLARVQGGSAVANLGRPADALRSLDRSEALAAQVLARRPRSAEALELRGRIETDRWALAPSTPASEAINRRARGWFDRALAAEPGRVSARLGVIDTEKNRANDLTWVRQEAAQAIPVAQSALAELRAMRLDTEQAALLEVAVLNKLGDAYYYSGQLPEALDVYRDAERLVDVRLARGESLQWLAKKGEAAWNVGGTLGDLDQPEAALAKGREGAAVMRRVLSYGPDALAEQLLFILYGHEATVLTKLGRPSEAVRPARLSLDLREARARANPGDPTRARELALGLQATAVAYGDAGRRTEACALARRSMAAWDEIAARGTLAGMDTGEARPKARQALADYC